MKHQKVWRKVKKHDPPCYLMMAANYDFCFDYYYTIAVHRSHDPWSFNCFLFVQLSDTETEINAKERK